MQQRRRPVGGRRWEGCLWPPIFPSCPRFVIPGFADCLPFDCEGVYFRRVKCCCLRRTFRHRCPAPGLDGQARVSSMPAVRFPQQRGPADRRLWKVGRHGQTRKRKPGPVRAAVRLPAVAGGLRSSFPRGQRASKLEHGRSDTIAAISGRVDGPARRARPEKMARLRNPGNVGARRGHLVPACAILLRGRTGRRLPLPGCGQGGAFCRSRGESNAARFALCEWVVGAC